MRAEDKTTITDYGHRYLKILQPHGLGCYTGRDTDGRTIARIYHLNKTTIEGYKPDRTLRITGQDESIVYKQLDEAIAQIINGTGEQP